MASCINDANDSLEYNFRTCIAIGGSIRGAPVGLANIVDTPVVTCIVIAIFSILLYYNEYLYSISCSTYDALKEKIEFHDGEKNSKWYPRLMAPWPSFCLV